MKENFKEFVTRLSKEDSLVGDVCRDLLRDKDFNWDWSKEEKRKYIKSLPAYYGSHLDDAIKEFLKVWRHGFTCR